MHSYFDLMSALTFSHNEALEVQYNYFLKKYPHIFKYVNILSRQATNADYYVPPSIEHECKVFSVTFNEIGCRKVGCFPKTEFLKDCSNSDLTRYIYIGSEFYLACQPACQEISKSVDTEFKNNMCLQVNTEKKIFALFPEKIHGLENYQPLHNGLDFRGGDLYINKNYCTAFGLEFENDECFAPIGQEIGEFFLGSTIFKSLKRCTVPYMVKPKMPHIPTDVQTLDKWLEGNERITKRSEFHSQGELPDLPEESISVIFQNLARDIAIDQSVDFSIQKTLNVLKRKVPKYLTKVSTSVASSKIIQSTLIKAISQNHLLTMATISKGLFSALSKLNVALSIFSTISSILDAFDPFNFNYVLDKETIWRVNTLLDFSFFRSNNRTVEITPEKIMHILEDNLDLYTETLNDRIGYYLRALSLEDKTSRSDIQKKHFEKQKFRKQYNWNQIFHALFVTLLIFLSLLFIKYFAYFLLVYFLFIFFYQPTFY